MRKFRDLSKEEKKMIDDLATKGVTIRRLAKIFKVGRPVIVRVVGKVITKTKIDADGKRGEKRVVKRVGF